LTAIKETRARYTSDTGYGASGPTNRAEAPMAERGGQLRALIAKRDAAKYSGGRVYTRQDLPIDASAVFTSDDFDGWVRGLTADLLETTGVQPAFDSSQLPDIVTADTLSGLLGELVSANSPSGGLLETFGRALGIVDTSGDIGPAVNLVHAYVGSRGGQVSAEGLIRTLGEEHRASADLAALYLLAFILSEKGEIGLGPGHEVLTRAGRPLGGDRLSWDLVPEVDFSEGMGRYFTSVSATASCDEHSARPYVRELPGTAADESWEEVSLAFADLARRGEVAAATAGRLATGLERLTDAGITRAAAGLRQLAASEDISELVTAAREHFGSPSALAAAVAFVGGIETLSPLVEPIIASRRYLVGMAFGAENADLELERDTVLARIDTGQLTAQPSLWSVVERTVVRLKDDFRAAYQAHHSDYHRRASELDQTLNALSPQIAAIDRLNGIPKLGDPVAPGLRGDFSLALNSVRTCPSPTQPDLSVDPVCAGCALTLTDELPDGEAIAREADAAIAEHGRRLALAASGRVLMQDDKPSLALFLELVQAGDAAKIANVLDDEVFEFLRDFVRTKGE
jgi:hypothetical protein